MKEIEETHDGSSIQTEMNMPKPAILTFSEAQPSDNKRLNEDACLDLEKDGKILAMVVDGATGLDSISDPSKINTDQKPGGHFVARFVKEYIADQFNGNADSNNILLNANNALGRVLGEKYNMNPEEIPGDKLPSASGITLVVVDMENQTANFTQLGDTAALIIKKDGTSEIVFSPKTNAEDVEALSLCVQKSRADGSAISDHFSDEDIKEIMIRGRSKENAPNGSGYGAVNGKSGADKYLEQKTISTKDVSAIILLTDGFVPPQENVGDVPDWNKIAEQISRLGLKKFYKNNVFDPKRMDGKLSRYLRFKIHDDATGVIIDLESKIVNGLNKRNEYFFQRILERRKELSFMNEAGLNIKEWKNVLEHCLVVGIATEEMAKLLELNKEDSRELANAAYVHDWDKYYERHQKEMDPGQKNKILEMFAVLNPDKKLLEATKESFHKLADTSYGEISLLEKIIFYVDDIASGSNIVRLKDRIADLQKRRVDLSPEFFEKELALGKKIETEIFGLLPEKIQAEIGNPSNLPVFLKDRIEKNFNS